MFSFFRKRSLETHRLGLVIQSASPAMAEPIFAKIPRVFPGVTFDLLTEDPGPRLYFRNVFEATGVTGTLRLLLSTRKRYDMVVVCATNERRLRFARALAVLLLRPQASVFVFNEFAEGFWLDRTRWPNIRQHLAMRYGGSNAPLLFRLRWKNIIGACGVIVVLPLIILRAAVQFVAANLARGIQFVGKRGRRLNPSVPSEGRAVQPHSESSYQSIENQVGEISYRQGASFGEPEKAMEDVRERIETRRGVFARFQNEGRLQGPFLEIGAGVSQTALLLRNEFGVDGAATDISLHALEAAEEIASRLGYKAVPLRICCDARRLPFQDNIFPLAYCFQTLHHFADPGPILREVERVLSPGGYFYLAEEPVRRWLCLNLYRCERLEALKGFDKWLFDIGLLRYVAEAYVGSKPEAKWGIMENQSISMTDWDRVLSVFDEVDLDASNLFAEDARIFREWLVKLGFPPKKVERLAAGLFGAELSGVCRARRSAPSQPKSGDLRQLCRCPECHRALRWKNDSSAGFECPACGPFPQENGVHLLFRRAQLEALYRSPADAAAAPAGASPEVRARKGRSPHPLVEGAQITRVRLLNARGDEVLSVRSGEETVLRVWIECSRPLTNPIIGFLIRRPVGGASTVIYDTNTLWQNLHTGEYSPGEVIEIRFCQRMNVGPGSYTITAAIASHDAREFYDWQEGILGFRVVESSGMQGLVNLHSMIEVSRLSLSGKPQQGLQAPFTLRLNGRGQARVLNQDSSVNLATNPARRGSVIQIFAGGSADTLPPWPSGKPAPANGNPLLRTRLQPVVTIGGVPARVLFSGIAPGFAGILQFNAIVPLNVIPGPAVPLEITADGVTNTIASIGVE